jgi:DNA-binding ferritin-like protein (Dps family)
MSSDDSISYVREAFFNPWHLGVLTVALVLSVVVSGSLPLVPLWGPLALVAGAELTYLGVLPRMPRFRRHVRSQRRAERHKPPSQKEVFQQLSRHSQQRYARLRKLRDEIESNYRGLSYASQGLLDSHLKKLSGLLDSYLNLLHQRERYHRYVDGATGDDVTAAIDALKDDMADDSERVRAVKKRRLHVLQQRLARFRKGQENLEIIGAQLETIEDVVKYIHEQSITLQNPEEVSFQLDTLLDEVEETQASVREIEDIFASPSDLVGSYDLDDVEDLDATDAELEQAGDLDDIDLDDVDLDEADAGETVSEEGGAELELDDTPAEEGANGTAESAEPTDASRSRVRE